jgi:hypothetical protein
VTGAIDKGHVASNTVGDASIFKDVGVGRSSGGVKAALFAQGVALVNFGIGVSQLDGNVTFEFVLEADGLDSGNGLDDCGLPVSDVTNGSNVDGGLTRNLKQRIKIVENEVRVKQEWNQVRWRVCMSYARRK